MDARLRNLLGIVPANFDPSGYLDAVAGDSTGADMKDLDDAIAQGENFVPNPDANGTELPPVSPQELQRYKDLKEYLTKLEPREKVFDHNSPHATLEERLRYRYPDGSDHTDETVKDAMHYQKANPEVEFVTHYNGNRLKKPPPEINPFPDKDAPDDLGFTKQEDGYQVHIRESLPKGGSFDLPETLGHEEFHKELQMGPHDLVNFNAVRDKTEKTMNEINENQRYDYLGHNLRASGVDVSSKSPADSQLVDKVQRTFKQTDNNLDFRKYLMDDAEMEVRLSQLRQTYTTMTGKAVKTPQDAIGALNYMGANMDQSVIDEIAAEHPVEFGGKSVKVFNVPLDRFPTETNPLLDRSDMGYLIDAISGSKPVMPKASDGAAEGAYQADQRVIHKMFLERSIMKMPGVAMNDAAPAIPMPKMPKMDFWSPAEDMMANCIKKGLGGLNPLDILS